MKSLASTIEDTFYFSPKDDLRDGRENGDINIPKILAAKLCLLRTQAAGWTLLRINKVSKYQFYNSTVF